MNMNDSREEAQFRTEVRQWIARKVPAKFKGIRNENISVPRFSREESEPFRRLLAERGWIMPELPKAEGGGGLTMMETIILLEECSQAGVPFLETRGAGTANICQILSKWGTPAQKEQFLRPTLAGRMFWCQGYSEPGSGSDLASLKLKADPVEGGYLLNGQKIWTSQAHLADVIFLLARTDPNTKRRQDGISFFVFDMKTPGIEIRPLVTIDMHHHFNETFFTNVRVPASGLVGQPGKGWTVAKALLVHERLNGPGASPHVLSTAVDNLKVAARKAPQGTGVMWDDPALRRQVAAYEMEAECLRYTRYRAMTRVARGEELGDETQFMKYHGSELFQRILSLHQQTLGPYGTSWRNGPFDPAIGEVIMSNLTNRARTIAGGTSEVQRNITAKRVLGLPD
ncbi:MAG: acyl-CoA dehydrogenase family protein [Candidatus Lambdaproteobacteria bacterium]|nr:acyl-CoA dehydrogenase family protein [Candidatus Lambdaproteobacteria bacterium]